MAVYEGFDNIYDIRFKTRLLRALIEDHLPDETHQISRPFELSTVVSTVKTHGLLSEVSSQPVGQRHIQNWSSAVDTWVKRLLLLISSDVPDKCWAGICFLGLTCQECGSDRFLRSYSEWFQKLLSQLQRTSSDSHFNKVACCASLSDLFTRLSRFPSANKVGVVNASKVIQTILELLPKDGSEDLQHGLADLLCTVMKFFPASLRRYYDTVEVHLTSKIMLGRWAARLLKKMAQCLALLPKARGDADNWNLMIKKILLTISIQLNDIFQGLEEETKGAEFVELLVPPGKEPPPPLGGQPLKDQLSEQLKKHNSMPMQCIFALMDCCCMMLRNAYSVQVIVPVTPLLAFIERVLLVDGSPSRNKMISMAALRRELTCSELPALHMCSLDLLISVIEVLKSRLLPHAARIVRFVIKYIKGCVLPHLRVKVYSVLRILLISLGAGITLYVAREITANALDDLQVCGHASSGKPSKMFASENPAKSLLQSYNSKRNHYSLLGENKACDYVVEAIHSKAKPISVQIAALNTLEALLTVGGSLSSESWRSDVDRLLITLATVICDDGWFLEDTHLNLLGDQDSDFNLQLAVYRALLASLLSPSHVAPPFLSRGLELFNRGRLEAGTGFAEFCSHALMVLEVLIHPRALPLTDVNSPCSYKEDCNHGSIQHNPLSSARLHEFDLDEELEENWRENERTRVVTDDVLEEPQDGSKILDREVKVPNESFMVEKAKDTVQVEAVEGTKLGTHDTSTSRYVGADTEPGNKTFSAKNHLEPGEAFVSIDHLPVSHSDKGPLCDNSYESSVESLPDIVDADPDSSDLDLQ